MVFIDVPVSPLPLKSFVVSLSGQYATDVRPPRLSVSLRSSRRIIVGFAKGVEINSLQKSGSKLDCTLAKSEIKIKGRERDLDPRLQGSAFQPQPIVLPS